MMLPMSEKGELRFGRKTTLRDHGVAGTDVADVRICVFYDVRNITFETSVQEDDAA